MLGSVDATKRTLTIPQRFLPYMEKHRIYELFHEIATELVIKQPLDQILYMKQCLHHAASKCNAPRIILLAPPDFDKIRLAEVLHEELGVRPVRMNDIHGVNSTCIKVECAEPEDFARNMKRILRTGLIHASGWVLVDNPRTRAEAQAFQRIGIIPTHVIEIIQTRVQGCRDGPDTAEDFHAPLQSWYTHFRSPEQRTYRKNLRGLKEAYANLLIEVDIGDRNVEELGRDCAVLAKRRKHCGAPCILRVALIGSRGSGCRTLARHLSERFGLVHVDFEAISEQARVQDTSLGEVLRFFENVRGGKPNSGMRIRIIEKYILSNECSKKGWVVTGYPINEEDFRLFDMLSTPPNRVIFVLVDGFTCRKRLLGRLINVSTGSTHDLAKRELSEKTTGLLATHPRDYRCRVETNIREYEANVAALIRYAGETASLIDGCGPEKMVRERVEGCLMRPAPCAPPRVPCPPSKIQPEHVEFDPDDEPDLRIFDEIREKESLMSLI